MQLTHGVIDVNGVVSPDGERIIYQDITTNGLLQVPIDE